ncbi:MAG: hypothetical protein HC780_27815 [Leptolyngbyaceae cyanobacterium CSU_1_3]|nr:hypothetical protein [Leptolyngbyaceae cyanobacterium CSU_1_3]
MVAHHRPHQATSPAIVHTFKPNLEAHFRNLLAGWFHDPRRETESTESSFAPHKMLLNLRQSNQLFTIPLTTMKPPC